MILRRSSFCACLLAMLATAPYARAEAPLSASQLHELCRAWHFEPGSTAAESCAAYVRGFLDGAANIDERTASGHNRSESYLDRARRTRLGGAHAARPPYCIDHAVPVSQVIDRLLLYCEGQQFDDAMPASTLLARVLVQFYAC